MIESGVCKMEWSRYGHIDMALDYSGRKASCPVSCCFLNARVHCTYKE